MSESGQVMVVDQEANDLFLLEYAFRNAGIEESILPILNVTQARDYLRGDGIYADRARYPLPFLLILDLTFPMEAGQTLLKELREWPATRNLPVIGLAFAQHGQMAQRAYDLGANAIFTKGVELDSLAETIRNLDFVGDILHPKNWGLRRENAA